MSQPVVNRSGVFRMTDPGVSLVRWFDAWAGVENIRQTDPRRVDGSRVVPFVIMHLMCLRVVWVGLSWKAVGTAAVQGGPLWWAAHHRYYRHSEQAADIHSPHQHSLLWSHMGGITSHPNFVTKRRLVLDPYPNPELRFLKRFGIAVPIALAVGLYAIGSWPAVRAPHLDTSVAQLLVWGFLVSTVALFHGTNTINSLAHWLGTPRYEAGDDSRNNPWLALLTFGGGWHNNHHHYPASARQGSYWWEVDLTYYWLVGLSMLGLTRDLRPVPACVCNAGRLERR